MQRHNTQEQSQLSLKAPKRVHLTFSAWTELLGFTLVGADSRIPGKCILFSTLCFVCAPNISPWGGLGLNVWMQAWTLSSPIPSSLPGSFLLVPFSQSVFRGSQHNWQQLLCWAVFPAGRWEQWMGRSAQCLELLLCKIWARFANEPNLTWFGAECWADKSFFPRKTDSLSWRNCTVCNWV